MIGSGRACATLNARRVAENTSVKARKSTSTLIGTASSRLPATYLPIFYGKYYDGVILYYILISFVASTKWEQDQGWPHSDPRMGSTVPRGRPSRLTRTQMSVETTYRGHL